MLKNTLNLPIAVLMGVSISTAGCGNNNTTKVSPVSRSAVNREEIIANLQKCLKENNHAVAIQEEFIALVTQIAQIADKPEDQRMVCRCLESYLKDTIASLVQNLADCDRAIPINSIKDSRIVDIHKENLEKHLALLAPSINKDRQTMITAASIALQKAVLLLLEMDKILLKEHNKGLTL